MKRLALKMALKALVSRKNSESWALGVGMVGKFVFPLLPPDLVTPEFTQSFNEVATICLTYAGLRFAKKANAGESAT